MFLTRAFLNPDSRAVQVDRRNPEDLHRTVMRAFPDNAGPTPRREHGVLYRLDQEGADRLVLLLQSRTRPLTERWPRGYVLALGSARDAALSVAENPACREIGICATAISAGFRFAFRLRANTTRKIDTKSGADGKRRHGRRVPLRGDEERISWLERRGAAAGFNVLTDSLRVSEIAAIGGRAGKSVTVAGAVFDGVLEVRDSNLFAAAIENGIGPAKAYGFGLLSIARLR